MRSKILLFLSVLLLVPLVGVAQDQGQIRGTITDSRTGESIPGVNVAIVERQQGAATNAQGEYEITGVPAGSYTLQATFVGYRTREKQVTVRGGETSTVNFQLTPGDVQLGEVVVTGQGSATEIRRLSTKASTVSGQDVEAIQTGRLDQALQSQLPNTQVRLNSGQPGTTSLIQSRGPVSSTGGTVPVIYVDGVRVDNRNTGSPLNIETGGARSSSIADIPLTNIERVEYVEGGAATTLYGSDAANGVLQVFTNDGSGTGENQLNFETRLGAEYGTDDYFQYDRTGEVVFEDPAFVHSYQLSGSGGTGGLNYSFSGKMYENNAARIGNENIRYDLNVAASATPLDNLQYTGHVDFVSNRYTRGINANFTTTLLRTENSLFGDDQLPIDSLSEEEFNPLRDSLQRGSELYDNVTDVRRWLTSQTLRYSPLNSVTLKVTGGLDYRVERNKLHETNAYLEQVGLGTATGSIADFNRTFLGLSVSANLNHEASWRFLSFKTDLGMQTFRDETVITRIDADNVPDGAETVNSAENTEGTDDLQTVAQIGFYLKENIGFGDRFYIDFGLRGDQNSAFGDEVGTVWYPMVGASYVVTDEPFIEEAIPSDIVSNVRLRGSYGEAGNFPNAFSNEREIRARPFLGNVVYTFGNVGAPDLEPQRTENWEVGANLGFLQDRLNFQITRYNNTTEDALFTPPFPPSSGRPDQERNLGTIENKGWEFSTNIAILDQPDYGLNFTGSLNTLTNEVVSSGGAPKFGIGGFGFLGPTVQEGQPVGFLETNRPTFNEDGVVTEVETDVNAGDPNPDQFGSLSLSGRYQGFSLRVTADYQRGAQGAYATDVLRLLNFKNGQTEGRLPKPDDYEAPPAILQGSLVPAEQVGDLPTVGLPLERLPPAALQVFSGLTGIPFQGLDGQGTLRPIGFPDLGAAFVEDTNYLKVRNISLNYRVPQTVLPSAVRSVRVGFSAQNPFNFVESNFDPEVSGSETAAGTVGSVFGYRTISPPRRYTFTLNIGL
jgi:outer membrane receptor protein involved in Fe transport